MKTEFERISEIMYTLLEHQPVIDVPYEKINDIAVALVKEGYGKISEYKAEIDKLEAKCEELRNEKWNAQDDLDCYCDEMPDKIKKAQIDVLNELKKKTHNYYPSIDSYCISQHVVLVRDIDELMAEVKDETES